MKVDAQALWRAAKNVSLFSREKGWSGGVTKFEADVQALRLNLSTSDDFVGIHSSMSYEGADHGSFYLSHKDLKELEKWLRDKSGEVHLVHGGHTLYVDQGDLGEFQLPIKECPDPEWWEMFETIVDLAFTEPAARLTGFVLDPARLSKMNLLEPKADYPLALRHVEFDSNEFVVFKYGPDTRGVISPLRREALEEAYGDKIGGVLW